MWRCWGDSCAGAIDERAMGVGVGKEQLVELGKGRERGEFVYFPRHIVVGCKAE